MPVKRKSDRESTRYSEDARTTSAATERGYGWEAGEEPLSEPGDDYRKRFHMAVAVLLVLGFSFGCLAARSYYAHKLEQQEDIFRQELVQSLENHHMARDSGGLFSSFSPISILSLASIPLMIAGGFAYKRRILLKKKEQERWLTGGVLAALGSVLALGIATKKPWEITPESSDAPNILLTTWRSMGPQSQTIVAVSAGLALLRLFQATRERSNTGGGGGGGGGEVERDRDRDRERLTAPTQTQSRYSRPERSRRRHRHRHHHHHRH
jgi:hypothetical protein